MFYEDRSTDKLGVVYCDPKHYSNQDIAEIFSRLLIDRWMDGTLDPDTAEKWATSAGHYGRKALAEQEAANTAHQAEQVAEGPTLLQAFVGLTKLHLHIQEK